MVPAKFPGELQCDASWSAKTAATRDVAQTQQAKFKVSKEIVVLTKILRSAFVKGLIPRTRPYVERKFSIREPYL